MKQITIFTALILLSPLMAQESDCPCGPHPHKINLKHLEYQGIGFNQGYTTLQLFLSNPRPWLESNYFFFDARGHLFNNGKPAANVGFGWRYLFNSSCHALGLNTYYDYRKTNHKNYNQVSLGLEYLAPRWEFRANGYLPFGSKVSNLFDLRFDHFFQNNFFVSRKREYAMGGADAEVGYHIKKWQTVALFVGIGPYYFKGHYAEAAIGGKARIKAQLTPYVNIQVGDSYDAVFHNRFSAELTLSIPFGGPRSKPSPDPCCSCKSQIAILERLHDAPSRNEMIVLDTKKKTSLGLDPLTGLPYFFVFVNNTSSSNGTFESPYNSFASMVSKPGDVIYVFPGDGGTTGMASGIVLQDNQRFLGSGVSHPFVTNLGTVIIPPLTLSPPIISNAALPVVTLALNNEVSGFNISGGTDGILGAFINQTSSISINRNYIQRGSGMGIDITSTNSSLNIAIEQNEIVFSGTNGIGIVHTGPANIHHEILSNVISNPGIDGLSIQMGGVGAFATSLIQGNTFVPFGNLPNRQLFLSAAVDAVHTAEIVQNRFEGDPSSTNPKIIIYSGPTTTSTSRLIPTIRDNELTGYGEGVILLTDAGSSGSIEANIVANHFFHVSGINPFGFSGTGALAIYPLGLGMMSAKIDQNLFERTGIAGISGVAIALIDNTLLPIGLVDVSITRNTITQSTFEGFFLRALHPMRVNLIENVFEGNGIELTAAKAIFMDFVLGGTSIIHVEKNQFHENQGGDFQAQVGAGATLCLRLNGNNSPFGYVLTNFGTFQLEEPLGNSGGLFTFGPIQFVPPGTCN